MRLTYMLRCRLRDNERDRQKKENKKQRDNEVAKILAQQVELRNKQREVERQERVVVAKHYRSDASALVQAEAAAKQARAERKKAVHEDLNKQLALKVLMFWRV